MALVKLTCVPLKITYVLVHRAQGKLTKVLVKLTWSFLAFTSPCDIDRKCGVHRELASSNVSIWVIEIGFSISQIYIVTTPTHKKETLKIHVKQ